ncbi:MAG: sulfur carrier protein ThiS [Eubacterium sp.]|nr:sulfur carrier protein ThiS [Eubacterium sp.]
MRVNGEIFEFGDKMTVSDLLKKMAYEESQVAVELNFEILQRAEFSNRILKEDDSLEVVRFVGGG